MIPNSYHATQRQLRAPSHWLYRVISTNPRTSLIPCKLLDKHLLPAEVFVLFAMALLERRMKLYKFGEDPMWLIHAVSWIWSNVTKHTWEFCKYLRKAAKSHKDLWGLATFSKRLFFVGFVYFDLPYSGLFTASLSEHLFRHHFTVSGVAPCVLKFSL